MQVLLFHTHYLNVQWAAVRTQFALINTPPQNCELRTLLPASPLRIFVNATCHGASPQAAQVPPTIFVPIRVPLVPEQGTQTEIILD